MTTKFNEMNSTQLLGYATSLRRKSIKHYVEAGMQDNKMSALYNRFEKYVYKLAVKMTKSTQELELCVNGGVKFSRNS